MISLTQGAKHNTPSNLAKFEKHAYTQAYTHNITGTKMLTFTFTSSRYFALLTTILSDCVLYYYCILSRSICTANG